MNESFCSRLKGLGTFFLIRIPRIFTGAASAPVIFIVRIVRVFQAEMSEALLRQMRKIVFIAWNFIVIDYLNDGKDGDAFYPEDYNNFDEILRAILFKING